MGSQNPMESEKVHSEPTHTQYVGGSPASEEEVQVC